MWNEDDRKWLYEKMKGAGINTGSYADFSASMDNDEDRDWYFKKAQSMGLNIGSASDFAAMMSTPKQQTPVVEQPQQVQTPAAAAPAPLTSAQARPQSGAYTPNNDPILQQMKKDGKIKPAIPSFSDVAEQTAFKPTLQNDEKGNPKVSGGTFNPVTGQYEGEGSFYTDWMGNKIPVNSDYGKAAVAYQQHVKDVSPINAELEEAYKERDRINKMLSERMGEIDKTEDNQPWYLKMLREGGRAYAGDKMGGAGSVTDHQLKYNSDQQYRNIMSAARKNRAAIKTLEDKKNGKQDEFWHTFGNAIANGYSFSQGDSELGDVNALINAQKHMPEIERKQKTGEKLTKDEEIAATVLKNHAWDNYVQQRYGDEYGAWATAGEAAVGSLEFGIDFLLMGPEMKAIAGGVMKLTEKGATKLLGEAATKGLGKFMTKYTGVTVGSMIAGAEMANTIGINRTMSDVGKRYLGNVTVNEEDGSYQFDGGKGFMQSLYEAEMSAAIENGSEVLGEFLPGSGMLLKGLEKIGMKKVANGLTRLGGSTWYKNYTKALESIGFHGVGGEAVEEYASLLGNALLVGDNKFSDLLDPRTHVDIWLGCAVTGGLLNAPRTVGYAAQGAKKGYQAAQYYRYKHKTDKADAAANAVWGDEWPGLRDRIDGTSNEDMTDIATSIYTDADMTPEQKRTALDYIGNLTAMRGYNMGRISMEREDENGRGTSDDERSLNNAFAAGYNATEQEDMEDAKNAYDMHRQLAENSLDEWTLSALDGNETGIDGEPINPLHILGNMAYSPIVGDVMTDEQRKIAADYLNAKARYDGMLQRVRDDIDSRISASDAAIDQRTNRMGYIKPATMKLDDRRVYVMDGDLVMYDDGSMIDVANSSESILVRDAETGKMEWASPHDFLSVDEEIDPAAEKEAAQAAIREQYAEEQAQKIDGVLPFNDGDIYSVMEEDGTQWTAQILSDNGDGTVQVAWNGNVNNPQTVSKDFVQELSANAAMARLAQNEKERAIQEQFDKEEDFQQERPTYNLNDEVTLRGENGEPVRGSITTEENEDGQIEVYTETPINGKKIHMFTRQQIDDMLMEHNGEAVVVPEAPAITAEIDNTGAVQTEASTVQNDVENVPETTENVPETTENVPETTENVPAAEETVAVEPMPMVGEGEDAEPDFGATTPQRAHDYIFNESGLEESDAAAFTKNNVEAANKELEKIKNKKPKMGTSIAKFNKDKAEWEKKVNEAQAKADYWKQVKEARDKVLAQRMAEQQERERQQIEKAQADEAAYREEMARKEAEQAALGSNNVSPAIREKWVNAPKVEGAQDEIVLPNGEKVAGRYYLVESGVASASHDSSNGFSKTEGFPVDENGGSVNDRDYERDMDAQRMTRDVADNYDSRAVQTPVVVSQDGVVLSGNGRTMAGELAAAQNTDGAYNSHIAQYPTKWGFTKQQVEGMQHPRVVFVPDESMPYTAETFAKFNQQEMKGQSKTEQAVKLGKVVSDNASNRIIGIINRFDTLGDFYADSKATSEAIAELQGDGVLSQAQMAEMYDGDGISAIGKELLENTLIGKAFESNPNAVREITEYKSMRQSIITALAEISNNLSLGKDYSLESELAQAIDLVYQARKSGSKFGEPVSWFARQQNLDFFGLGETVADYNNAAMLMIADIINDNRSSRLKKNIQIYNHIAQDSANGQLDLFTGSVKSKEEIINGVKQLFNNGSEEEQQKAAQEAVARRKAESVQENGSVANGSEVSENTGGSGRNETSVSAGSRITDPRSMSDEERQLRGEMLRNATAIDVVPNHIVSTKDKTARKAAEEWWDDNVGDAQWYETEAGEVEINRNSVESSLAHGYGQMKLDAITSLVDGFRNAVYLGTMSDSTRQDGVLNHYFAYPINYNGKRSYVFCRALHDNNTNRLYVHEVFVEDKIKKGNTLQTAASQPHGGISLYRDILANVLLSDGKDSENPASSQAKGEKVAENQGANGVQAAMTTAEAETNTEPTDEADEPAADAAGTVASAITEDSKLLNIEEVESLKNARYSVRETIADHAVEAYLAAESEVPVMQLGIPEHERITMTYERFLEKFRDIAGNYLSRGCEPYLHDVYDHIRNRIEYSYQNRMQNAARNDVKDMLASAEEATETNPTDAQKEAGNYKKGHVKVDGFDITIENPKGSVRRGTNASGKQWEQEMQNTYGYIRGTEGVDGDHIDVFFSDEPSQGDVFVVDQVNADGSFDEHKVMYGFASEEEARKAYLSNYEEGWQGLGAITHVTKDEFKKWVQSSHRKTKPFADYKNVKVEGSQNEEQPMTGSFGPIYTQFKGKSKEAIAFLLEKKDGEAIAALHHKDIGDIDLVWGNEGTGKSDGYGLAKLAKFHPEVLDNLQEILDEMVVTKRSENRVQLESETHQASVRLTWDNEKKNWLLTAFEKKNSVSDNTTDTVGTTEGGKRNDTATPQNTVSDGKVANNSASDQENGVKSYKISSFVVGQSSDTHGKIDSQGNPLTDEEVAAVIDAMKAHATVAPTIEITDDNWKDNIETPIGNVKMGAHQKEKLFAKGRESQYGMLVETLSNPDIVLEEKDKTENLFHERPSSYLFIKTFQKSDGSKYVHFESVTVSQEGMEISVSSHIIREQALEKKLKNSNVIYKIETLFPNSSEMHLAEHQNDVSDLLPTQGNNVSGGKVTNNAASDQENGVENGGVEDYVSVADNMEDKHARQQKGSGMGNVSPREAAMRDALVDVLRDSGVEVVTDVEEGQLVLDMANGEARMQAKKRALETASLSEGSDSEVSERSLTVVSSADGAKILKNIDVVIQSLENSPTQPKTFVGDIANALGATRHNSKSEYATFETKNGRVVTIRLADHNATVSNFDNRGELDGISIVVSPKKSAGVTNDGDAHVVEYYYDAIKLRKADGKPLADIVRSIKQALYSGEFEDTTGLAERQEVNADKVRFFRTPDGHAYGFTKDGKIYIDSRIATAETPIHEYSHLWASAFRKANPKEWANIVELMKGTTLWDEVKQRYPELKTDDEIADEVLAQYSGRRGAERLRAEQEKIAKGEGDVFEKAEAISMLDRVRRALVRFWKGVADWFGIRFTTAEEVADKVLSDLLYGVDPVSAMKSKGEGVRYDDNSEDNRDIRYQFVGEKGAAAMDKAEDASVRLDNLAVAREMEAAGKDAKAVKLATGWERGADGKWRYEIEDFDNSGLENLVREDNKKKLRLSEHRRTLLGRKWEMESEVYPDKYFDEFSDAEREQWNREHYAAIAELNDLSKEIDRLKKQENSSDIITDLGVVIGKDHELLKYYPELEGVAVHIIDMPSTVGGNYKLGVITLNRGALHDSSILNHEVQHAIQEIEGFARGGSVSDVRNRIMKRISELDGVSEDAKEMLARQVEYQALASKLGYVYERLMKNGEDWAVRAASDNYWEAMNTLDNDENSALENAYPKGKNASEIAKEGFNREKAIEELKRLSDYYASQISAEDMKNIKGSEALSGKIDGKSDEELYLALGGEVEARNVQNRLGMTAEERRASLASETEDVAREDQIFLEDGLGVSMSESASETDLENVNRRFNDELGSLTEKNKDKVVLSLGRPSDILLAAGVSEKPMKLYGNKVVKKMKKHGFALDELRDLPRAVADPIAVFDSYQLDGNRTVLTELQTKGKNIMVAVTLGKDGIDVDFNIVSSVFGKGENNIVDWLNKGYARYINKEKALDYLHHSDRHISEALSNPKLDSVAKIVENFENPKVVGEKNAADEKDENLYRIVGKRSSYKANDGSTVTWRSLFSEEEMRGISEEKDGAGLFDPTSLRLRKLEAGETCHVERRYVENGMFDFTGKDKVESADDVAYIFRQLENAAVENSFMVLVKDGKPTVIHLAMGAYTSTMAPFEHAFVAYSKLNPDEVYFVHNHPSGKLKASRQDQESLDRIKKVFGNNVVKPGIIIDTTSGKYGIFDGVNIEQEMPVVQEGAVPIKVYNFGKQVFARDWNPRNAFKITSSDDVASFVSSHRLGEHKKMSLLVLGNDNSVVANLFLPFTRIGNLDNVREVSNLMSDYIHQCGGVSGLLYGNYDYTSDENMLISKISYRMKELGTRLMDVIHVEHSAYNDGLIYEPEASDESLDVVNRRFNDDLDKLNEENAQNIIFEIGNPGNILRSAGLSDMPIRLYGNKLIKKMRKHGFDATDVKDLPKAINDPIAVFNNYDNEKNRAVLTELKTSQGNVLVTIEWGKGTDAEINIVTSVFGKGNSKIVDWINKGFATYINKSKALDYLRISAPIAEAQDNRELSDAAKVVENFENPKVSDENVNDDTNLYRIAEEESPVSDYAMSEMVNRVNELAAKLHLDNIEIVTDASTLSGDRRRAKGFYNRKTGKITIVVANHTSLADLEKTVLHESVAHHGLRKLFGEHFNTFLDNVFRNADADVRKRITRLAAKHGWDFRKATEEYLAGLAEDTDFENAKKTGWWEKVKRAFLDMLHKIAFEEYDGDVLTDNELRYILWRSYSNLENGEHGVIKAARNEVMKQNLLANDKPKTETKKKGINQRVMEITDSLLPTSVTYSGEFLSSDAKLPNIPDIQKDLYENVEEDDIFYRDGDPEERNRTDARYWYEQRVKSGMYQTREAMLDSMLGLHEAMKAIYGKDMHIEDIADFENAYLGENRLSSMNQDEWDCFEHLLIKPLLKEVSKLEKDGSSREEVTRYMMAKHGLERNEVMARRAAEQTAMDELRAAERAVQNDPLDQDALDALDDVKQRMQDRIDALYNENRERDYAGITGLMEEYDVSKAEGMAQQLVDEFENKHEVDGLWQRINDVSKAILSKQYECGIINKETYDDISSMYEFYIPLRGFAEKTSEEAYAYLTNKNSAFNAPIKKAHGRKSVADDPIVNLQTMAQSSILMGNRNKLVKQRFLNFVLNHPSDLVSVNDLWVRYDDVEDEWKAVFPDNINDDDSSEVVEQKMKDFEEKMQQLAKADPKHKHYKHGKDTVSIPYRVVGDANLRQHQVLVKRNGRDYVITINGNPRAAQALNGLTNPDNRMSGSFGSIINTVGAINRTLSTLYTTMSIDFVAGNFLRDTLYANTMVWIKESPRYAARFNKNYVKTKRVMHLLGKYRNATLDMNNETEKMFYQFMKNGGETGYMRMADIDEHRKQIKKALKTMNEKIPARMAREFVTTWIGEVGRGIEMRSRFAAFITSREMGRTIGRSIWDAKEISVNFNKKGAGDKFIGATGQTFMGNAASFVSGWGRAAYLFWNASLQGTFGNFGKYAMRHKGKAATAVALTFGLGLLITALAAASGDDDDDSYFDQPEHIRRQNIVFKLFGKTWGKIPLPIEHRAVYGLGELAGCVIFNHEKLEYDKLAKQLSQVLPVDLLEGYKGLIPTLLKPAYEAANNESWYGTPIWKDTPYNKHMPEWTKSYKSTDQRLVALSETLNELSGGSKYKKGAIDINPAKMEYLLKQYSGGLFTLANQLGSMYDVATGDKEFDWRYAPVLNRMFMTGGDERNVGRGLNEKFFKYMDAYDAKTSEFSAIRNDLTIPMDKKAELISEIVTDPEYMKMRRTKHVYSKMNQAYKQAMELGNTEAADHLLNEMNKLKRKFIDEMEADDASK